MTEPDTVRDIWSSTADTLENAIADVNPGRGERVVPAVLALSKQGRKE